MADDKAIAEMKASTAQAKDAAKLADEANTTTDLVADNDAVSRTEHAAGQRQPDDGTYDEARQQPPLEGRDVPQKLTVVENYTPTPGEDNA